MEYLIKGVTYTFVHPSAHPLRTSNGTHGGGDEFTTINTDTDE